MSELTEEQRTREMEVGQELEGNGHKDSDSNTLFEKLRQRRETIGSAHFLDLDIPGYEDLLYVRFNAVEWDDVKNIGRKALESKHPRRELMAQCDLIARCTGEILMRDPETKEIKPLHELAPEFGDEPVRWDQRLLTATKDDRPYTGSAREAMLRVIKNDLAVTKLHDNLVEWLQSARREDDEDFSRS